MFKVWLIGAVLGVMLLLKQRYYSLYCRSYEISKHWWVFPLVSVTCAVLIKMPLVTVTYLLLQGWMFTANQKNIV